MIGTNSGSVSMPPRPHPGLDVLSWCVAAQRTLQQLRDRRHSDTNTQKLRASTLHCSPLVPRIIGTNEDGSKSVMVTRGCVIEYDDSYGAADGIKYHEISNLLTDGVPTQFEMTDGKAIYVSVPLTASWTVDTSGYGCQVVVDDDGKDSVNPSGGTGGTHYYKLGVLSIDEDGMGRIEYFLAGDNITAHTGSVGLTGYVQIDRFSIDPVLDVMSYISSDYLRIINGALKDIQIGGTAPSWGSLLYTLASTGPP